MLIRSRNSFISRYETRFCALHHWWETLEEREKVTQSRFELFFPTFYLSLTEVKNCFMLKSTWQCLYVPLMYMSRECWLPLGQGCCAQNSISLWMQVLKSQRCWLDHPGSESACCDTTGRTLLSQSLHLKYGAKYWSAKCGRKHSK